MMIYRVLYVEQMCGTKCPIEGNTFVQLDRPHNNCCVPYIYKLYTHLGGLPLLTAQLSAAKTHVVHNVHIVLGVFQFNSNDYITDPFPCPVATVEWQISCAGVCLLHEGPKIALLFVLTD
jgi:hypothetical protein